MKITPDVFEAYLKCPTKCWLRATDEPFAGGTYSEWVKAQNDSYRVSETRRLVAEFSNNEVALSPDLKNFKVAKWRLASSLAVHAQMDFCALESELHALERVPAEGWGKPMRFIPIRFVFTNKLSKDNKLLLALDAFTLSKSLRREISVGKIVHSDDHTMLNVKTSALTSEVRKRLDRIARRSRYHKASGLLPRRHPLANDGPASIASLCIQPGYQLRASNKTRDFKARESASLAANSGSGPESNGSPCTKQPDPSFPHTLRYGDGKPPTLVDCTGAPAVPRWSPPRSPGPGCPTSPYQPNGRRESRRLGDHVGSAELNNSAVKHYEVLRTDLTYPKRIWRLTMKAPQQRRPDHPRQM